MVTMNATMNGTVNSLPLCDRKIRGGHSGYLQTSVKLPPLRSRAAHLVFDSVSQKPKATSNAKPMAIGTTTRIDDVFMYVVLIMPTRTKQTPGITSTVPT